MMKNRLLPALGLMAGLAGLQAQVEHKAEWLPVREVEVTVPAPPHLKERIRAFENRDSKEAVESLARQLFGLMNPDHVPEDPGQAELYREAWKHFREGRFADALESYKRFSFARLRKPPAGVRVDAQDPAKRVFIEFYNQPDELMKGIFRFQVFDKPVPEAVSERGIDSIINYYRAGKHNAHMVDLVVQNGMPGRMNWTDTFPGYVSGTWHMPDEKAFAATAYRTGTCFVSLLSAYATSGNAAYLQQWAGYMEDMLLNYRRDLAEAGIKMPVNSSGAGGPDQRHIAYLILNSPNIDQDFPATTFARFVLRQWVEDLPLIILGSRATGANRAMHMYGALLTEARMRFPELKEADTLLEERRRILESYAHEYMMPDGTSIDYAPNYNKNYIMLPPSDVAFLGAMKNPPAWFTPDWVARLDAGRLLMARYLVQSTAPDGTLPGYKDPLRNLAEATMGKTGFLAKSLPAALSDPKNKAVIANLLTQSAAEDPGYLSQAFPYGGYYIMRESWDPKGRYLYFHDYRPGENGSWRHHKNLFLQAFGQRMLTSFRWESPLLVDGAGHINVHLADLYPKSYEGQRGIFGTHSEHSAWQDPIPSRWHTSGNFDLAEGNLKIPFAEKFGDDASVFVDDVAHGREVVFLRAAGAWVVTDRIRAQKPHDYRLLWPFESAELNPPGWENDWRNKNKKPTPPRQDAYTKDQIVVDPSTRSVRTQNPSRPNLSVFHAASVPLDLRPGDIRQEEDAMYGNSYGAGPGFRTDRDAVVTSLLYPRDKDAPDLAAFQAVELPGGAGFDAKTPGGVEVFSRAALAASDLQAAGVAARATSLIVSRQPGRPLAGIALDCEKLSIGGREQSLPSRDFEFVAGDSGAVQFVQIHRPMSRVRILPESNLFVGSVEVRMESPAPDAEIRYTLDGSEPDLKSALYTGPLRLDATTTVTATAFRKEAKGAPLTADSTLASLPATAVFTKAGAYLPAASSAGKKPGLAVRYFEDDWTLSMLKLPVLSPVSEGVAREWLDISPVRDNGQAYALVYEGYLNVPKDGIYTFRAPFEFVNVGERAGYDLRLEVNGRVWYPETATHAYGTWSIPLAAGAHPVRLSYVDIRRWSDKATFPVSFTGKRPELLMAGPGMSFQQVPSDWLSH